MKTLTGSKFSVVTSDAEGTFVDLGTARARISPEDAQRVGRRRWYLLANGYVMSRRSMGRGERLYTQLHRFIMHPTGDMVVDHINGDTLDNRRANLRICTKAENCRNREGSATRAALVANSIAGGRG